MNILSLVHTFDDLPTFLSMQEEFTLPELYTIVTTAFGFPLKQGKTYNKAERQQIIDFVREHLNWDDDLHMINGYLEDWRLTGYVALPVFYWTRPSIVGFITLCLEYHMILEANKVIEAVQAEEEESHWDGYVDITMAQALADKSHRTIRSWIEKGLIEAKKENPKNRQSKWMINRKSLLDYLGDGVMLNPLDLYPVEEDSESPFFDQVDLEYNADCDYNVVDVGLTSRPEYAIEKSLNILIDTFLSHFPVEHHKFITKFEKQSSTFVVAFKLAK